MKFTVEDTDDPVAVGKEIAYLIKATNQGNVPLHDITITNTLPPEVELLNAEGPVGHKIDGRDIIFDTIDSVDPGQTLEFRIMVNARIAGSAVDAVTLTYREFDKPVTVQEGTTIY